jgi:hypothetical protein
MAHGYPDGKYRGGDTNREKSNDGPGKNAEHGKNGNSENHSQKHKGSNGGGGSGGGWNW